ncbi:hypothetical protein BDV29DRAFT_155014 [Aspergillus leporis]|uniref:Uncharacterized protein n=1 Tax=Aspergillus leporis TaxID=41062 RepID=A0A5N5X7N6_9EURO|nr:hypothetical protein BDV29DRAFT_155014 [Aspergillus leporis]
MNVIKQSAWIPAATLTFSNPDDQTGRVFIVTGGYSGVGYELSKIPYGKHGTIDIAGRNQEKAEDAINGIRSVGRSSHGQLEFLKLGLANFASIPESAADFLSRETRLDALKNNAGPIGPDACTRAMVGIELTMSTNCLGPFFLTQCLLPLLQGTTALSSPGSIRVRKR